MSIDKSIAALKQITKYLGLHMSNISVRQSQSFMNSSGYYGGSISSYGRNAQEIIITFISQDYGFDFETMTQMSYQNASSHKWLASNEAHDGIDKLVYCRDCNLSAKQNIYLGYMIFTQNNISCKDLKLKNLLK